MTYLNTCKLYYFITSLNLGIKYNKFRDISASDKDVVSLFTSILKGYHIGCITSVNGQLADGRKRCSILLKSTIADKGICNVFFDSLENKFIITTNPNKYQIHISNLYSTTNIRKFLRENFSENDSEYSMCEDNIDNFCSKMLDSVIPVFSIEDSMINLIDVHKTLNKKLSDDTGLNLNLYTI